MNYSVTVYKGNVLISLFNKIRHESLYTMEANSLYTVREALNGSFTVL